MSAPAQKEWGMPVLEESLVQKFCITVNLKKVSVVSLAIRSHYFSEAKQKFGSSKYVYCVFKKLKNH